MAHLLSVLRRSSIIKPHLLSSSLCSSSSPIKPISYPPKPTETPETLETPENLKIQEPHQPPSPPPPRQWASRQDLRFAKDAPTISPVSYPTRVAPLPEDRAVSVAGEGEKEGEEELRREARRITRSPGYFGARMEEEIPYPTMIPEEKKLRKEPMDLSLAIKQVKGPWTTSCDPLSNIIFNTADFYHVYVIFQANAKRNFLETVEAHVRLGVDPRRGDQMVRGAITLPHGTGKTVRVAVFAEGPAAEEARSAGADIIGGDELIEEIKIGGGKLNFDKCIATPMFAPRLTKIARILGPRGLMPNPKLGSVTSDVSGAVKEAKCGRIDFKMDKTANVHVGIGKVNFSEDSLEENIGAFVNALLLAKPVGLKKTSKYVGYVKSFTLSSTMGPGFPVTIPSLSSAADNYNKVKVK